jgi:hypothetical protein
VQENHQRTWFGVGVDLFEVFERQVGLQGGLRVDGGGCEQGQQGEQFEHCSVPSQSVGFAGEPNILG